jgi:hypothetical protein
MNFMRLNMRDAQQQALSFLTQQISIIEPQVYAMQYPEIQYPSLVPVDTSGSEWAKSVTFFSKDMLGKADWVHHYAKDIPLADITRDKFEQDIEMAGIGYRYTLEELGQALMTPFVNLTVDRAAAARRAYEEFVDNVALRGDTQKNWTGLINAAGVAVITLPSDGTGSVPYWSVKTEDQITRDFNSLITAMWTASNQQELADTILLPPLVMTQLAQTRLSNQAENLLSWILKYNLYTQETGLPLTIKSLRGLESAGSGGVGRIVAYKRDPSVLKFHLPMPHRFFPIWQTGPMVFDVPGVFRLGGVEVKRPGAMRYADGVNAA